MFFWNQAGGKDGAVRMTEYEEVLLTLFYTNTKYNYSAVGSIFGVASCNTVTSYIDRWLPLLGEIGDMLSIFTEYLVKNVLHQLMPYWCKEMDLTEVATLVDGKDFFSETCRHLYIQTIFVQRNEIN